MTKRVAVVVSRPHPTTKRLVADLKSVAGKVEVALEDGTLTVTEVVAVLAAASKL